jgi:hypothetical protein
LTATGALFTVIAWRPDAIAALRCPRPGSLVEQHHGVNSTRTSMGPSPIASATFGGAEQTTLQDPVAHLETTAG